MNQLAASQPADVPTEGDRYRFFPVLIPFVFSLVALAFTDFTLRRQEELSRQSEFTSYAARLHERLRERVRTYDEILRGAAGLFRASSDVSRAEWHAYVASLALDEGYVGIQGLGYAKHLTAATAPDYVNGVRAEGFPEFAISPSGARDIYGVITYLEPFYGRNIRAFGFDMLSESVRREAMLRARDSSDIVYSGRVTLKQETDVDVQAGFLAYLPVYRGGVRPPTVEQRRAVLQGWVYAPFRLKDLIDAVLQGDRQAVSIRLSDRGHDGRAIESLLFDSRAGMTSKDDLQLRDLAVTLPMEINGRVWSVRYEPASGYQQADQTRYRWLAMLGVGVTGLLLCVLTWVWLNTRLRAEALAAGMTRVISDGEERFKLLVEGLKDYAIVMLDDRGTIMTWNAGAERIKGWSAAEVVGRHFSCFFTEEDRAAGAAEKALATALITGRYSEEGWRIRKDGSLFRASVLITAMRDAAGQITGFAKVTRDVSERYKQEEGLRLAATVFRSTQEGVVITDVSGCVVAVNPAFERITEYAESEVMGQRLSLLASGRHQREFFQKMWRDILDDGGWQGEIWNRRKGGEIYPSWLAISAVRNERGELSNFVGVYADMTRIPHAETQMERLAHHDPLTGLPNRMLLQSRLGHTLERMHRTQHTCAVMFLDLDRFKAVNDQYGHEAGDELLKEVARSLRLHLRENDTVARLGGDEFVVVLEDLTSAEGAILVARAIIDRLNKPFRLSCGHDANIGCSVGISIYPNDGDDVDALIRQADIAMYKAKQAGRGTWCLYRGEPSR